MKTAHVQKFLRISRRQQQIIKSSAGMWPVMVQSRDWGTSEACGWGALHSGGLTPEEWQELENIPRRGVASWHCGTEGPESRTADKSRTWVPKKDGKTRRATNGWLWVRKKLMHMLWSDSVFFYWGAEIWTQGLHIESLHFVMGFLEIGSTNYLPRASSEPLSSWSLPSE
jgi:hypothetical protein